MNLKNCEKKEKGIADIVVEISPEELQEAINKVFSKNRNRISVPGFRKGKAPRKIIEKMYGDKIFHSDAFELLLPDVLDFIMAESELKIIGQPEITDVDVKEGNNGADVMITVNVYPEVKIGQYKGLKAVKPVVHVLGSEIDNAIDEIRNRNARIEKVDRPVADGDMAVIDFQGFVYGEPFEGGQSKDYEVTIGSDSLIPGFEEGLIGMSAGEERDLELRFPDGYEEPLAGKPVVFKVKLIEAKEKLLPELDDEFAKDVSEFDTLEEYRADLKAALLKQKETEADDAFEIELLDNIADTMEVEIPGIMVEKQMDNAVNRFVRQASAVGYDPAEYLKMMGTTPDEFRESSRASSEHQVKIMLALEKIAELEGIEPSSEDIENEYIISAGKMSMEVDKLKESVPEESVILDIKRRLASDFVIENAIETDPVTVILNAESQDED